MIKSWGLFNAADQPVATGDAWHSWQCPQQQFVSSGYEHPITCEWVDEGLKSVACPFNYTSPKVDTCSKCGMVFKYP